ncbi:MAG: hypothetical protein HOO67_00380 [Candidatus Peribacteraceae bacterium]|nr:hypothetical protein [Candidatus Peribacteraceae bacterium]
MELFSDINLRRGNAGRYGINSLAYSIGAAVSHGGNIEEELEVYTKSPDYWKEVVGIKFYLRDLFKRISNKYFDGREDRNNYSSLLQYIRRVLKKEVAIITFNYDSLFEVAMTNTFSKPYRNIHEYVENDMGIYLMKLHGSEKWGRKVDGLPQNTQPFDFIVKQSSYTSNRNEVEIAHSDEYLPSISVPVVNKDNSYFECPNVMLDASKNFLKKTTKLIIIGWRGLENHFSSDFLSLLNPAAQVYIVSDTQQSARKTYENLFEQLKRNKIVYVGDGFSGLLAKNKSIFA